MKRLNFACGSTRWAGFENSDINGEPGTRYIDLEKRPLPYEDECADLIMISHALQMTKAGEPVHPNLQAIMHEFHRILVPGGWLRIDDNPLRIYNDEDVPVAELNAEAHRGFPDELRIRRSDFIEMLMLVGFDPVVSISPDATQIPVDVSTRAAIVGNHLGHYSFALEAQKA